MDRLAPDGAPGRAPHLEIGWGGVALRDTVLVTTTGSRVLNRSARGLVVLD